MANVVDVRPMANVVHQNDWNWTVTVYFRSNIDFKFTSILSTLDFTLKTFENLPEGIMVENPQDWVER